MRKSLKAESDCGNAAFKEEVDSKCNCSEDHVKLNTNLLDVAAEVCGQTKGKPRQLETRWRNVAVAIDTKWELFKIWKRSSNERVRRQYCEAKKVFKRVVAPAMDQASREAIEEVEINCDSCELFQIAKQRTKEGHDVLGVNCLKDKKGVMNVTG